MLLYGITGLLGIALIAAVIWVCRLYETLDRTRAELKKADDAYERLRSLPDTIQDRSREAAYLRVQLEMRTHDLARCEDEYQALKQQYQRFDQLESAYRMKIDLLEDEALEMRRKLTKAGEQLKANEALYQSIIAERDETIEALRGQTARKPSQPRRRNKGENRDQISIEDLILTDNPNG